MRLSRLFSQKPTHLLFPLRITKAPHYDDVDALLKNKFTLVKHFVSTFEDKPNWRKTEHQLFLANTSFKPIAFTGIEIGDGDIIQSYIGSNPEVIFDNKTCFIHAMEVLPEYRGYGLQMLLWKKLCEQALQDNIHSIIWNPADETAYLRFFDKFNLVPKQHLLSQIISYGEYFDGDSTSHRCHEETLTIFQIKQNAFAELHQKLKIAIQGLKLPEETHGIKQYFNFCH